MQSLQLKVAPTAGYEASWDTEDIVGLEKFFEAKVREFEHFRFFYVILNQCVRLSVVLSLQVKN